MCQKGVDDMSSYSEGQVHQLMEKLEAEGWSAALVTALAQSPKLPLIKGVLEGTHEVVTARHIIDCDADPFTPNGWKVESHKKGGKLEWDAKKVKLHLSPNQQDGKNIEGNKLRKELAKEPVLNANILDYLLAHTELIPEEWKGKAIFFWGTVYRGSDGYLCVRYLGWHGVRWYWGYYWLHDDFIDSGPAACSQVSSE